MVDTYLIVAIIMLCRGAINDFVSSKAGIDIFVVLHNYFGGKLVHSHDV